MKHARHLVCWSAVLAALVLGFAPAAFAADAPIDHNAGVTVAARPGGLLEAALFYTVAVATGVSALGCCLSRNIVRMAVWLFCALGSVALLYFLLAATFIGAIQLIVYAGGTLILLIFGVMLTSKSPWARLETHPLELFSAGLICAVLFAALCLVFATVRWNYAAVPNTGTPIVKIGESLMTTYLVPFEVAGVLLMVVMVGAAHLARQEKK